MIGLSTYTANSLGNIILQDSYDSNYYIQPSRITRYKVLDGGYKIVNNGVNVNDRSCEIIIDGITEAEFNTIKYIYELSQTLVLSTREGVFLGMIKGITKDTNSLTFTFLVFQNLSEE